jgi:hypothetical protein
MAAGWDEWGRNLAPGKSDDPFVPVCAVGYQAHSFLKRHADAVGINRAELFRAPGLVLQCAIGVHFSPSFLVFGIHGLNAFYGESHHGLVADLARQFR